MGPRAIRNQERYLQQALKEREEEIRKQCQQEKVTNTYESTAFAAQKYANEQLLKAAVRKEVDNQQDVQNDIPKLFQPHEGHAITFWSHHLLAKEHESGDQYDKNDTLDSFCSMNNAKRKSFAKHTSFTNDIHDGRLQHACN